MNKITRPIPRVYNYVYGKLADLTSANSIQDNKTYGSIYELTFRYPKYLLDKKGNTIFENGLPLYDTKVDALINEMLVEFNGEWYIIKSIEETRDVESIKNVIVYCKAKASELSYKQVPLLNMSAPITDVVLADHCIHETLTYPYQIENGYGFISTATSTTATLGVDTADIFDYNGYKLSILSGVGKNQIRKITSYNTSTKVATIDTAWDTIPNSASTFRVHNSKYKLGLVSPVLLNDGVDDIYRGFTFEGITIMSALGEISETYGGYFNYATSWDTLNGEFITTVSLVVPSVYNNTKFEYKKNLNAVTRTIDSSQSCYTRVYPEGRNNTTIHTVSTRQRTDSGVTYDEHTLGYGNIYNFQYYLSLGYTEAQCRDLFVKDFQFYNEGYTDAFTLYDGAKKALSELSIPKITYQIEGVDLSVLGFNHATFGVGDTVKVRDSSVGFNFSATVISKNINWDRPYEPSVELSNFTDSLGDLYLRILKYNARYADKKSKYGKGERAIIADEATSSNYRNADYIIPRDGSVKTHEVINRAIADISAKGGGDVIFLDGRYGISSSILPKANVNIYCNGTSTEIYPIVDGIKAIEINGEYNISINQLNFGVDGTISSIDNYFEGVVSVIDSQDITVTDCLFQYYSLDYGVYAENSSGIDVSYNRFYSETTTVLYNPLYLLDCSDFNIYENRLKGNFYTGFLRVVTSTTSFVGEISMYNNYIDYYNIGASSTQVLRIDSEGNGKVLIFDNTIIVRNSDSIAIGIQTDSGNVNISSNEFDGCFTRAIWANGATSDPQYNLRVLSNTINIVSNSTSSAGICCSTIYYADIQNNTVSFNSNYVSKIEKFLTDGIGLFSSSAMSNVVANNNLKNSGTSSSFFDRATDTRTLGGNSL